jgi:chromosome segregation ATPase
VQQSKDGDITGDSLPLATAILTAIEAQGNNLKRLIEDTKLSINTRLDALDAVLVNVQAEQSGVKKKVEELELAMTGCDSRLEKVERICEELRSDNKFLRTKVNDLEGRSCRPNLKFVGIKEGA